MARLQNHTGAVPFDQTIMEALELFCNAPEQTYEQFLSTFTHLTPDNAMGRRLNVLSGHNNTSLGEMDRRDRECMARGVDAVDERTSSPRGQRNQNALSADLEELELDVPAGRLTHGATFPSDPPGKIPDNCPDDTEDQGKPMQTTKDVCVLPGEVEEALPVYTLSFCHYTLLELFSAGSDHRTHTPQTVTECQSEGEEVVPFCLDDTFDYDSVELLHRHPIQCCASTPS
ncbi:intraflagellar transport-associated protein isoform X2 [Electrophorus electricus]|nr:intraflagellar transport-associated protein isoform X2 [Electrophorus electricus]